MDEKVSFLPPNFFVSRKIFTRGEREGERESGARRYGNNSTIKIEIPLLSIRSTELPKYIIPFSSRRKYKNSLDTRGPATSSTGSATAERDFATINSSLYLLFSLLFFLFFPSQEHEIPRPFPRLRSPRLRCTDESWSAAERPLFQPHTPLFLDLPLGETSWLRMNEPTTVINFAPRIKLRFGSLLFLSF